MPSIPVTAVSTGSDTLTATAPGLNTGDRFRLRNVGGALPAATPSLSTAVDVFAIRVDANTLKVATSNANALAGIFVDITGSGSGSTTVDYDLPLCRPTAILAPLSQVKSRDLQASYESLVTFYEQLFYRQRQVIPNAWLSSGTAPTIEANPSGSTAPVWKLPTGQTVRTRIPYEPGDTVATLSLETYGDGAIDWIANLQWDASSDGTGGAVIGSNGVGITNETASWKMSPIVVSGADPMTSGGNLWLEIVLSGGTQLYLGSVEIGMRRLP